VYDYESNKTKEHQKEFKLKKTLRDFCFTQTSSETTKRRKPLEIYFSL